MNGIGAESSRHLSNPRIGECEQHSQQYQPKVDR